MMMCSSSSIVHDMSTIVMGVFLSLFKSMLLMELVLWCQKIFGVSLQQGRGEININKSFTLLFSLPFFSPSPHLSLFTVCNFCGKLLHAQCLTCWPTADNNKLLNGPRASAHL